MVSALSKIKSEVQRDERSPQTDQPGGEAKPSEAALCTGKLAMPWVPECRPVPA